MLRESKRGRGRPSKYKTKAERTEARRKQTRERVRRHRNPKNCGAQFVDNRRNPDREIGALIEAIYTALVEGRKEPRLNPLGVRLEPSEAREWAPTMAKFELADLDRENRWKNTKARTVNEWESGEESVSGRRVPQAPSAD